MHWIDTVWSMSAGGCLTLAAVYFGVWFNNQKDWSRLAFTFWTGAIAFALMFELSMMHARTPEQYEKLIQWRNIPFFLALAGYIWFVRSYLQAGRIWLMWLTYGVNAFLLAVNFVVTPNIDYSEIIALNHMPLWGETAAVPVGVDRPWRWVIFPGLALFLLFMFDVIITAWRYGRKRKTLVIGSAILTSGILTIIISITGVQVYLGIPLTLCLPSMVAMLVIALELSRDLSHVNQISRHLELNRKRMRLAAEAANLGMWEWDMVRNRFWFNETSASRLGINESEDLTFEKFLESLHPDDRELTRQNIECNLESGRKFKWEYRVLNPDMKTRLILVTGQFEQDATGKPLSLRGVSMDITDRKLIEDKLRKSEQALRKQYNFINNLTNVLPDTAYSLSMPDGKIEWGNEALGFLGYETKECIGRTTEFLYANRKDYLAFGEKMSEAFALGKKTLESEVVLKRKNGEIFLGETKISLIKDKNGKSDRVIGSIRDISERKRAERQLLESEVRFRATFEQAAVGIAHVATDGRFMRINRKFCNILGYSQAEMMKLTFRDITHPDHLAKSQQGHQKVLNGEIDTLTMEKMYLHKDGLPVWASLTASLIRSQNGDPEWFVVLIQDISARKQAEAALNESEKRLKEAQHIAHIGSWELDLLTNTLIWSEEIYRIFEIAHEKFGTSYEAFLDAVHPEDRDTVDRAYRHSLESRTPYSIDHRLIMPDGRIKYVHEQCYTYYSPEGKPLRSVGTVQDNTGLKKAEIERAQLENELAHLSRVMITNELSGTLAHEINQPLGAIMNNASAARTMCSESGEGSGKIKEILDDIITDTTRAGEIIHKVRGLMGKEEARFEELDLNSLIKDTLELYRNTLIIEKISVSQMLQPDLSPVIGDRTRLQQVLMNLLTNAVEAMMQSPLRNLNIRTAMQSPGTITVSVSDSGPGIDAGNKIFQPFFTTKRDGLGLGLRICRSIIEEHGGRIWVEDSPAGGAAFSFSLNVHRGEF